VSPRAKQQFGALRIGAELLDKRPRPWRSAF
jgi:hypothetical protein